MYYVVSKFETTVLPRDRVHRTSTVNPVDVNRMWQNSSKPCVLQSSTVKSSTLP